MNAQTEIAVTEDRAAAGLDLSKFDLTDVAMAHFGPWEKQVADATHHFSTLHVEMPTQAKVEEFKSMRQRWINTPLATARATAKGLKSKLTSTSKDVGGRLEEIEGAWAGVDQLITPQIDARQAELDAEKEAKAQAEAARKQVHMDKIANVRAFLNHAQGLPSERIEKGVELVAGMAFGADCEEFLPQYETARSETMEAMRSLLAQVQQRERDEAQRLENERVARELEEQRQALAKQAAELAEKQAEAQLALVALTHAATFTFPAPEPVAAPAAAPAQPETELQAEAIRVPQPAGEPPVPMPPAPAPATTSLVGQNNAARASIASTAPVVRATPAVEIVWINTATVSQALGIHVSADLLASVGHPGTRKTGPAMWWDESKLETIQAAIFTHSTKALAAHRSREAVAA